MKYLRLCVNAPVWLAAAALFLLMIMTFCDVVARSSFDAPIQEATELTRILVAITVFAVMPHVTLSRSQIAVDLTDTLFDRFHLSTLRDALLYLVCGGLLFWPVGRLWTLMDRTRSYGDVTEYIGIPQYLPMGFIALSVTLTALCMVACGLAILLFPSQTKKVLAWKAH